MSQFQSIPILHAHLIIKILIAATPIDSIVMLVVALEYQYFTYAYYNPIDIIAIIIINEYYRLQYVNNQLYNLFPE